MFKLSCKIEIEGDKKWVITNVVQIKIERNINSTTNWCEIELPSKIKWDKKTDLPLKTREKIKVYLGYDGKLELAFKGYVNAFYDVGKLIIFCVDEMWMLSRSAINLLTIKSGKLDDLIKNIVPIDCDVRIDEKIYIGDEIFGSEANVGILIDRLYRKYDIKAGFIFDKGVEKLSFGRLLNEKPRFVYDLKKNVIKNELKKNNKRMDGVRYRGVSVDRLNKKLEFAEVIGTPPYKTVVYRYRNLTLDELKAEVRRRVMADKLKRYNGKIVVFGGKLAEKYDLIELREGGKTIGVYEVAKNEISFGVNGFRQTISLGDEKNEIKIYTGG